MRNEHILQWVVLPVVMLGTVSFGVTYINKKQNDAFRNAFPLISSINQYYQTNHKLPSNLDSLELSEIPVDYWLQKYQYTPEEFGKYIIKSSGPDKQFNTNDDLTLRLNVH